MNKKQKIAAAAGAVGTALTAVFTAMYAKKTAYQKGYTDGVEENLAFMEEVFADFCAETAPVMEKHTALQKKYDQLSRDYDELAASYQKMIKQ